MDYKKLLEAVKANNLSKVARLVDGGVNINCKDSNRRTVLHYAAGRCMKEMIEYLVQLGADINAKDRCKMTPLHCACLSQADDTISENYFRTMGLSQSELKSKIAHALEEAQCTSESDAGMAIARRTIIEWSENMRAWVSDKFDMIETKKIELIDCLCDRGAKVDAEYDMNVTSLNEAIRLKNVQAVKVLAKLGLVHSASPRRRKGYTAFISAAMQKQQKVMKHLVKKLRADVNAGLSTIPILHAAVASGNEEIVQTLLDHGADTKCAAVFRQTPVFFATAKALTTDPPDLSMLTCLADLGADFDIAVVDSEIGSEALALETSDILKCLLQNRASIGFDTTFHPITKMALVAEQQNVGLKVLEHLKSCGANINARNDSAVGPILQAANHGHRDHVAELVTHGFNLNEMDYQGGLTILQDLILNECTNVQKTKSNQHIIDVLISLGADINARLNNYTVLHSVVAQGKTNMVKVLVELGAKTDHLARRGDTLLNFMCTMEQGAELHRDTIKIFLKNKVDLNFEYDQVLPIHIAVENSDIQMVRTLSSLGANLDRGFGRFKMASYLTFQQETNFAAELLETLIAHEMNINSQSVYGITPLLQALQRDDTRMVKCLCECGADRNNIGILYHRITPIYTLMQAQDKDVMIRLMNAGADLVTGQVIGDLPLLSEKASKIACNLDIIVPKFPIALNTLLACFIQGSDASTDILEKLLCKGANKSPTRSYRRIAWHGTEGRYSLNVNIEHNFLLNSQKNLFSNLHIACSMGNLDIVRMLIADGSDVNELDSSGMVAFEHLPLGMAVNYHTLNETRTTEKAIEMVDMGFSPVLPLETMEGLLRTPGIGDTGNIELEDCHEIHDLVYRAVCKIGIDAGLFSEVISCGSAAEGTKVGLPDEADFLAVTNKLDTAKQANLRFAGDDYMYYFDPTQLELAKGSKQYQTTFTHELHQFRENFDRFYGENGDIVYNFSTTPQPFVDKNRRATTAVTFRWNNKDETLHVYISVDIVPSLHIENNWPEGGIEETWLMKHEQLQQSGYYLVPKPPHASTNLASKYPPDKLRTLWKISFPHLETYHMKRLEKRVKDVYLAAKCVRNPDVCRIVITDGGSYPRNPDKYVSSYMLKMVFFKNVKYFLANNLSLGEMVCQVYDQLEEGLKNGFIPLYFMPEVSALAGHKLNIQKSARVAMILKKFVHALYLQDQHHVLGLEDTTQTMCDKKEPMSVYSCIEISEANEMPETKLWYCS